MEHKDIFISYKNDGIGNQFAYRLVADLKKIGYSIYFNPHEQRSGNFPERLRLAVNNCQDFILILSPGCLEQLKRNEEIDWVREEILTAREAGKPIIPLLIEGTKLPKHAEEMPETLRFLPFVDAIAFPEDYVSSPFSKLQKEFRSRPNTNQPYKGAFNSNPDFDVDEDFKAVLAAAENGDADAMYELGMMYYYGYTDGQGNAARNPAEAYRWLKNAIDHCDSSIESVKHCNTDCTRVQQQRAHTLTLLSKLYYAGQVPGEPQSYEKAFNCVHEAAPFDGYAALTESFMLRAGIGCKFDYEKIIDFHVNTIQQKDDQFRIALADFYRKHGRFQEAMELYNSLTNVSPEADYQMGLMHLNGLLTDPPVPDPFKAAYHLRYAADHHHSQAAFEFGLLCFRPTGHFRKDFKTAQEYLTIAADNGIAEAQYILGYMYEKGHVEKSLEKAIHYYTLAMQQGQTNATYALAICYQEPEFQNYQLAYECAELAASHGAAEAELLLGNFLFWGRGCKPDVPRAIGLYQRALEHGVHYASIMLEKARKSLQ